MEKSPLIFEIKGNSLDDGPGIRTVVFFKGCPLSCVWCHNPESKRAGEEISFDADQCIGCGTCLETCPDNALSRANTFFIDRDRCSLCFKCVESCPAGALAVVGRRLTHGEILARVIRDKPFYDVSGGGVTLSGGEPALHMDFVSVLLKRCKEEGLHTLMETSGQFDCFRFEKSVLPYLDIIYFDIKLFDPVRHRQYCGIGNETILQNFARLSGLSTGGRFELLPRVPLIPGITDSESNLRDIARFLKKHGATGVRLLPYNPLWHKKSAKIGVDNPYGGVEAMTRWMPGEQVQRCEEIFREEGLPLHG
ncbi:MAG: glycyl-radical enzyme activating protein [Bacillota bacterium]